MRSSRLRALLVTLVLAAPAALPSAGHAATPPRWLTIVGKAPAAHARAGATAAPQCPENGGVCHTLFVPLDRDHPAAGRIGLRYEVFSRTDRSRPALPPIFLTEGGPGASLLNDPFARDAWVGMLKALNGRHDIVAIDQRGVGQSGAIDCPLLERGSGNLYAAAHRCGTQLGRRSDLYGSSDVAADLDAIRRRLGAPRIDFFGSSYAGVDIQAYALRYPRRLHAAVLDSPSYPPDNAPAAVPPITHSEPQAVLRTVTDLCALSRACAPGRLQPARQVAWLARRLRAHPLDGVGIDDLGGRHRIHLTEGWLIWRIVLSGEPYVGDSEIAAAAVALRHGDSRPLLRLAAEGDVPLFIDTVGDPTRFSAGDNEARFCSDTDFPWDERAPEARRWQQYTAFKRRLPASAYAPFSVGGWLVPYPVGFGPTECIRWPAPTHHRARAIPAGARFSHAPVLILSGSIDLTVPSGDARRVAAEFPRSTYVQLRGSGHDTTLNTNADCGQQLAVRFLRTWRAGDTSCVRRPDFVFPAVGAFPRTIAGERQAVPGGAGDRSTTAERRAVSSAWDAIRDTLWHQYVYGSFPESRGPGLRGGTFALHFDEQTFITTLELRRVRFTGDLAVTGTVVHDTEAVIHADVRVRGVATGRLHLTGSWLSPAATAIEVSGTLNGHHVAVREPTN
jgi:pimeloyl-ACP methyl ester carboxylesterase